MSLPPPPRQGEGGDGRGLLIRTVDFGPTISDGSPLAHEFRIENTTGRTVRITGATPAVPCCSGFGPLPERVSSGQIIRIPITIRTENRSGPLRVEFVVNTDAPALSVIRLVATVNLIEEFAIEPLDGQGNRLTVGRPAQATYRVVHRRVGNSGSDPPSSVSLPGPFVASFEGPPEERAGPGGLVEWRRDVNVSIPAPEAPGRLKAVLRVSRADGRTWERPLLWDVKPQLWATPEGLIIRTVEPSAERSMLVQSLDRPFTIRGVEGSIVRGHRIADGEPVPELLRTLVLRLDGSQSEGATAAVRILTDHPSVPVLQIPVIVMP